ncbi:hypothetical protein IEQ34_012233 [Dendrobium chrysotoxum]|uniref:Uncharacterized protein n=1 Tax=Dendrobium chrysotoxum TaxID=161865 RepID=A0AAV7GCC0_DENCH|nr:hypothetical protein IEQ34_012233 [Dendrobium chrysotoxum]
MEQSSSQPNEDAEECSSSESGWTMYLASPMHDGSNGDDDDDGEADGTSATIGGQSSGDNDQGKEDDDSMASDASSGTPCKQQWNDDDRMCHVNHGTECREDGGDVVKEKNSLCSSRPYPRKNHNVERGKEKAATLSNPSDHKEENGDSISIRSSSKMRRIKSSEK